MEQKFIKLKIQDDQSHYVNPVLITSILEIKDSCAVYTIDGRSIYPQESVEDVMKKIKESSKFTLQF
jgi:uncharacterized protein YlzI (FlbEa/FlbD family)